MGHYSRDILIISQPTSPGQVRERGREREGDFFAETIFLHSEMELSSMNHTLSLQRPPVCSE